jgi:hypothetical protein
MEQYLEEYINMDYEKICLFLRKFSKKKLLLFDLISFSNIIQNITQSPIDPIDIIENKINKQENKSTNFLFNIDKLNLIEFYDIMNHHFNLTLFECIIIYDKYTCNKLNKYRDNYELDMKFLIQELKILNKKIEIDTNENNYEQTINMDIYNYNKQMQELYQSQLKNKNQKTLKKLNSTKYNIFRKFAKQVKIRSNGDLYKYFQQFDKNNDDIINKDELLDILNTFNDFNDYEKISMINYASKNQYDEINILKFINIINSIKLEQNELEEIENFSRSRRTSSFFNSDLNSLNSEYFYRDILEIDDNLH